MRMRHLCHVKDNERWSAALSRDGLPRRPDRQVIFSADDFGSSVAVNEAVEWAHREGLLSTASLMVAGAAAADAVRRARRLPTLRVGLHVVVIEGAATLPSPRLVDARGWFPSNQLRLGLRYAFDHPARRQLRAEIEAQFAAFAATGLRLDHANAHKHMHLHPVVGAMVIDAGRAHGLTALRIPAEPAAVLRACGAFPSLGARVLQRGTAVLRWQARRAGLVTNDHAFGLAWSGHMTEDRLLQLASHLPPGLSEIYFHPATQVDPAISGVMPGYEPMAELQALLSLEVRAAFSAEGIALSHY